MNHPAAASVRRPMLVLNLAPRRHVLAPAAESGFSTSGKPWRVRCVVCRASCLYRFACSEWERLRPPRVRAALDPGDPARCKQLGTKAPPCRRPHLDDATYAARRAAWSTASRSPAAPARPADAGSPHTSPKDP